MGAYRSELEAARAREMELEAAIDRIERERARLEAALRKHAPRRWPWIALAVGSAAIAAVVGASTSPRAPAVLPPDVPAQRDELAAAPMSGPTPPLEPGEPTTPADSAFFGQYWRARVTRTGPGGPPVGTECLITLDPGLYGGAGVATVRCGGEDLHRTAVTPPHRENQGFCWFDGRELYCAPPNTTAERICWVSTAANVAMCRRDVDLYIHTNMRDPRARAPASID